MSEILVRNLDPELVERLKTRAKLNRRSLQAEVREILEREVRPSRLSREEFLAIVDRIRSNAPPQETDSVDLIREDRDR
jgi:plasmid stability protein